MHKQTHAIKIQNTPSNESMEDQLYHFQLPCNVSSNLRQTRMPFLSTNQEIAKVPQPKTKHCTRSLQQKLQWNSNQTQRKIPIVFFQFGQKREKNAVRAMKSELTWRSSMSWAKTRTCSTALASGKQLRGTPISTGLMNGGRDRSRQLGQGREKQMKQIDRARERSGRREADEADRARERSGRREADEVKQRRSQQSDAFSMGLAKTVQRRPASPTKGCPAA